MCYIWRPQILKYFQMYFEQRQQPKFPLKVQVSTDKTDTGFNSINSLEAYDLMCFVKCILSSQASHITNLWVSISSGVNFQGTFLLMVFGAIAINFPIQSLNV